MMTISVDEDCGNAPKKQFVRDFLVAVARGDGTAVGALADSVRWDVAGEQELSGKDEITEILCTLTAAPTSLFRIDNILSHGNRCAADGHFENATGTRVRFSHHFQFTSHAKEAKLSGITSYLIGVD